MKSKKSRPQQNHLQYYMYGKHACLAAIKNPNRNILKLYCTNNFLKTLKDESVSKLIQNKTQIVDNSFITSKLKLDVPHQGIIALVQSVYLNDINDFNFHEGKDKIAALDQITDPQNIGTIIRSAAAFGVNKIILPKDNTPDESAAIAKAACGCLELVQVAKVTNLKQTLDTLKKKGFWVVGMDVKGTSDLLPIQNIEKSVTIIGSEGKGMRQLTSKSCDYHIKLPISKDVESLNAASAASIIFYLLNSS